MRAHSDPCGGLRGEPDQGRGDSRDLSVIPAGCRALSCQLSLSTPPIVTEAEAIKNRPNGTRRALSASPPRGTRGRVVAGAAANSAAAGVLTRGEVLCCFRQLTVVADPRAAVRESGGVCSLVSGRGEEQAQLG